MADDSRNKFKDLFCAEVEDRLSVLSRTLLLLEEDPRNAKLYETLMQSAHTIKGGAATMGYAEMARLAHALEDVFHAGERGALILTKDAVSTALSALDQITRSLAAIKNDESELSVDTIAKTLEGLLLPLKETGSEAISLHAQKVNTPAAAPGNTPYSAPTSIRVPVERLDTLMGLFEEMLMLRLKLDTMIEPVLDIAKTIDDPTLKQKFFFIKEFQTLFAELARLLSETQGELLRVRLVPLEQIFGQFPRMVRDLALREEKKVNFRVEGEGVELDRTVLEGLGGALAHLLRNAVDHGIEKEGAILLRAERKNDRVHVIVEDNGGGISYERVRKVAHERGIITEAEVGTMKNIDTIELLFHPNLSTAKEITDISGRGVGLSAVRAFTQDVGGRITVISPVTADKGTRFLLDLPVSLATVKVLIVQSSGFTFAVPFANIIRTFVFTPEAIIRSAHQEAVLIEGKPIPIFWLSRLLGITFGEAFRKTVLGAELRAVLISIEQEHVVLIVDAYISEQELLVKSLPPILRGIKGFSGSTLLPDGRTVLLLDTYSLLFRAFGDILGNVGQSVSPEMPHLS
jgi:two-component system chemotaxis sensor kinase CheA